jgi:hypothetical protein
LRQTLEALRQTLEALRQTLQPFGTFGAYLRVCLLH